MGGHDSCLFLSASISTVKVLRKEGNLQSSRLFDDWSTSHVSDVSQQDGSLGKIRGAYLFWMIAALEPKKKRKKTKSGTKLYQICSLPQWQSQSSVPTLIHTMSMYKNRFPASLPSLLPFLIEAKTKESMLRTGKRNITLMPKVSINPVLISYCPRFKLQGSRKV